MRKYLESLLLMGLLFACNRESPETPIPYQALSVIGRHVKEFTRADNAFEKKDYTQAIEIYTGILELDSDNLLAYARRGYA